MREYENLEFEVIEFEVDDVLTDMGSEEEL